MHEENSVQAQLVGFARRIAVHQGYPDLVNGLQPLERLKQKYEHEKTEFLTEVQNDDGTLDATIKILSEAADMLYYSSCIYESDKIAYFFSFEKTRNFIASSGVNLEQAERAAISKYELRSASPNSKDFEKENAAIKAALYPEE